MWPAHNVSLGNLTAAFSTLLVSKPRGSRTTELFGFICWPVIMLWARTPFFSPSLTWQSARKLELPTNMDAVATFPRRLFALTSGGSVWKGGLTAEAPQCTCLHSISVKRTSKQSVLQAMSGEALGALCAILFAWWVSVEKAGDMRTHHGKGLQSRTFCHRTITMFLVLDSRRDKIGRTWPCGKQTQVAGFLALS